MYAALAHARRTAAPERRRSPAFAQHHRARLRRARGLRTQPRRVINTRHGMGIAARQTRANGCTGAACAGPTMSPRCAKRRKRNLAEHGRLPAEKLVAVSERHPHRPLRAGVVRGAAAARADARSRRIDAPHWLRRPPQLGQGHRDADPRVRACCAKSSRTAVLVLIGDGSLRQSSSTSPRAKALRSTCVFSATAATCANCCRASTCLRCPRFPKAIRSRCSKPARAALPIVATAVGGNAEIVHEGVNGHIVPRARSAPRSPMHCSTARRSRARRCDGQGRSRMGARARHVRGHGRALSGALRRRRKAHGVTQDAHPKFETHRRAGRLLLFRNAPCL